MDVIGVEWRWSGQCTETGEPLLIGSGDKTPLPLSVVYRDHGPLIPLPARPSKAMFKDAISGDFARTVEAGYVESYEDWARRTAGAAP
ncbi:hypothetical protein EAO71_27350 [Streptomyces sp. ms191]|nr:hypothetical protein EAO71_27350 [Streptomyces sp. ms191]